MKRVGIVCEFNPFHNGHRYLLDTLRAAGAQEIVCVMSQSFVQRCEPGVLPARERAAAAVYGGADAVFALPFPWCSASAEFFAEAGMYLLQKLGCDTVAFGSESGDLPLLSRYADAAVSKATAGEGTAAVYDRLPPNDILGTAYLRACNKLAYAPQVFPVVRIGAGHAEEAPDGTLSSSSAVRRQLRQGILPAELPGSTRRILQSAVKGGLCPTDTARFSDVLWAHWRVCDVRESARYAECGGGVAERLAYAAGNAAGGEEMFRLAATKKYTDARLRRAALYGYLRICEELLHQKPAYTRLLACSEKGREVLRSLPSDEAFSVVSNVRNLPDSPAAEAQNAAEQRAEAFLTMLCPAARPAGTFYKSSPVLTGGTANWD